MNIKKHVKIFLLKKIKINETESFLNSVYVRIRFKAFRDNFVTSYRFFLCRFWWHKKWLNSQKLLKIEKNRKVLLSMQIRLTFKKNQWRKIRNQCAIVNQQKLKSNFLHFHAFQRRTATVKTKTSRTWNSYDRVSSSIINDQLSYL